MKKFLLLIAALTLTMSAVAATPKRASLVKEVEAPESIQKLEVRNHSLIGQNLSAADKNQNAQVAGPRRVKAVNAPEGTVKHYTMSAYVNSMFGIMYATGIASDISFTDDGSKVYFGNMFTGAFYPNEVWIPGNVSTDGSSITVPHDYALAELEYEGEMYTVFAGELILDESGANVADVKDIVFKKDGDLIYLEDDEANPQRYVGVYDYEADGSIALWDFALLISYEPYEGEAEAVVLPEGAEPAEFLYYSYVDFDRVIEKGQVYVDGNDVYMNRLAPGVDAWLKGTKDGNKVTFPAGQFLPGDFYFYYYPFYVDGTTDESGYLIPFPSDAYVLDYDPETGIYSNLDATQYSGISAEGDLYDYINQFEIKPYDGDKPAVPSDPYDLSISDEYLSLFGEYFFSYMLDPLDVNGEYINPEYLSYYIYMDGDIYTLTPDVFTSLDEEMTLIPYGFTDGWSIVNGALFLTENLFNSLGVQAVYTVDDVTNYSNVVSVDLEGNVTVTPAPQGIDGLNNVAAKQITSVAIYDAEGRKLDAAQQGVNIVKMVAADGSVKTVKMFKK